MLIRSEFFLTMFSMPFIEAQETPHLQIVPIDVSPTILEIILTFLYTEKADFNLDVAVDVLFAADMLFLEKVKAKAAVVISTLANGTATTLPTEVGDREDEEIDIYEILRAAWLTRVQRLEEFAARYIAYRLERYIDDPEFAELVKESASRISKRQETDSIELLDDIRYYLSERFRLRFEDTGLDETMDEEAAVAAAIAEQNGGQAEEAKSLDETEPQLQPEPTAKEPEAQQQPDYALLASGAVRTLDGDIAGDERAADAVNYQILLGKIDGLLEVLKLDA
jgi:ankyrin repeat and BTB/POZ domain-containing protein 1